MLAQTTAMLKVTLIPPLLRSKLNSGVWLLTHTYPLSKRTSIYTGVGFRKVTVDYSSTNTEKVKAFEAALGLTHKF